MTYLRSLQASIVVVILLAYAPGLASAQGQGESVYARVADSVFLLQMTDASGETVGTATGFLVESALLLTNAHVAAAGQISIQIGALQIPCVVERIDDANDLALCRISAKTNAPPLKLANVEPKLGTTIYAIGNPRGLEKTISQGLFNGHRTLENREVTQISSPISPGSSGGPIVDGNSEVIAVAVSSLMNGQNLNFAVPLEAIRRFVANQPASTSARSLFATATNLTAQLEQLTYSPVATSDWGKTNARVEEAFKQAIDSTTDTELLNEIYDTTAIASYRPGVAVLAARKALTLSKPPKPEAYFRLARALYYATNDTGTSKELDEAEQAATRAAELARPQNAEYYQLLGNIQSQEENHTKAYASLLRASAVLKDGDSASGQIYFELFSSAAALNQLAAADNWFGKAKLAGIDWLKWNSYAKYLAEHSRYKEAAAANMEAARLMPSAYANVCSAGANYYLGNMPDEALAAARGCIAAAASKKGGESEALRSHKIISGILFDRGVYDEAVSHAKEAIALDQTDGWAYFDLAQGLRMQRRFTEAVSAAKNAIRLTDGKYSSMHFELGQSLFDLQQWPEAAQAYEKTCELNPKDAVAAYNAAASYYNQRQYETALKWYREVLRRDPNYSSKDEVQKMIQQLSK